MLLSWIGEDDRWRKWCQFQTDKAFLENMPPKWRKNHSLTHEYIKRRLKEVCAQCCTSLESDEVFCIGRSLLCCHHRSILMAKIEHPLPGRIAITGSNWLLLGLSRGLVVRGAPSKNGGAGIPGLVPGPVPGPAADNRVISATSRILEYLKSAFKCPFNLI